MARRVVVRYSQPPDAHSRRAVTGGTGDGVFASAVGVGERFPGRDGEAVATVPARAGAPATPLLAVAVPLVALLVLNMADVATTHRILGMGGREMNPAAGWLLAN